MVRDIEEMGGVRWDGEASARLQVMTWVYGRAMPRRPRIFISIRGWAPRSAGNSIKLSSPEHWGGRVQL